jgi:hypothetical protein
MRTVPSGVSVHQTGHSGETAARLTARPPSESGMTTLALAELPTSNPSTCRVTAGRALATSVIVRVSRMRPPANIDTPRITVSVTETGTGRPASELSENSRLLTATAEYVGAAGERRVAHDEGADGVDVDRRVAGRRRVRDRQALGDVPAVLVRQVVEGRHAEGLDDPRADDRVVPVPESEKVIVSDAEALRTWATAAVADTVTVSTTPTPTNCVCPLWLSVTVSVTEADLTSAARSETVSDSTTAPDTTRSAAAVCDTFTVSATDACQTRPGWSEKVHGLDDADVEVAHPRIEQSPGGGTAASPCARSGWRCTARGPRPR